MKEEMIMAEFIQVKEKQTVQKKPPSGTNLTPENTWGDWTDLGVQQQAGNYVEAIKNNTAVDGSSSSNTSQLSKKTLEELEKDARTIIRLLQNSGLSLGEQTLVISLLSKWKAEDGLTNTPHLDKIFKIFEDTKFINSTLFDTKVLQEYNGIEKLFYLANAGKKQDLEKILRSSVGYHDYFITPENSSALQWEALTAQEIRKQIVEFQNYEEAESLLNGIGNIGIPNSTDVDDVSLELARRLSDKDFEKMIASKQGLKFLLRLYDELSSGSFHPEEIKYVQKIHTYYEKSIEAQKNEKGELIGLKRLNDLGSNTMRIPMGGVVIQACKHGFKATEKYASR